MDEDTFGKIETNFVQDTFPPLKLHDYPVKIDMGERLHKYGKIRWNESNFALLTSDEDVAFLLANWDGDMVRGLFMIMDVIISISLSIIALVRFELRTIFSVYLVLTIVIFHGLLVRNTIRSAMTEIANTRQFIMHLPTAQISVDDMEYMRKFFIYEPMDKENQKRISRPSRRRQ